MSKNIFISAVFFPEIVEWGTAGDGYSGQCRSSFSQKCYAGGGGGGHDGAFQLFLDRHKGKGKNSQSYSTAETHSCLNVGIQQHSHLWRG